jgi:hypothetical protein
MKIWDKDQGGPYEEMGSRAEGPTRRNGIKIRVANMKKRDQERCGQYIRKLSRTFCPDGELQAIGTLPLYFLQRTYYCGNFLKPRGKVSVHILRASRGGTQRILM